MTSNPGTLYNVGGRRYVDSQAIYNISATHDVVPTQEGWRVLIADGSVRCALVEHTDLPGQQGALYELCAEGCPSLEIIRAEWLSRGIVRATQNSETWPGQAPPSGCGCGGTCGVKKKQSGCGCQGPKSTGAALPTAPAGVELVQLNDGRWISIDEARERYLRQREALRAGHPFDPTGDYGTPPTTYAPPKRTAP